MTAIFIVIIILVLTIIYFTNHNKRLAALEQQYHQALKGKDKGAALTAGRAYYSTLRNKKLTIYDEQAIANDLSTMTL